jgi:hypothetical protein
MATTDEEDLATETATAAAREEQKAPLAALLDGIASASDGALGLAHADWTAAQWERFAEELTHLLLPFARRVALFLHLCGGLPAPALPDPPASPRQGTAAHAAHDTSHTPHTTRHARHDTTHDRRVTLSRLGGGG